MFELGIFKRCRPGFALVIGLLSVALFELPLSLTPQAARRHADTGSHERHPQSIEAKASTD
jgi:hypothetical protein